MVFVDTVREHVFAISVRVPGSWINLDRVLLMQPVCSLDLVAQNFDSDLAVLVILPGEPDLQQK